MKMKPSVSLSPRERVGVRAYILPLALLSSIALAAEVPQIADPVTDLAKVLSEEKVKALSNQLEEHKTKSGVQLAVLTIDTTDGEPIETYSLKVARKWGGGAMRRNDGGLFLLAIKDRRMRIELGYGLEGRVTDLQAQQLLDRAKSYLRDNDPDGAVQSVMGGLMMLTVEGTMTAAERASLDTAIEAAQPLIPPEMRGLFAYIAMLLVFGIIGRAAKSRLNADDPPPKKQVAIILGLLIVAAELGFGVAGWTWFAGWGALCGTIAGLTFLFSGFLTTLQWPLFMGLGSFFSYAVAWAFGLGELACGLAQLLITLGLAAFDRGLNGTTSGISFDSLGASSGGSRSSSDDDESSSSSNEEPSLFSSTRSSDSSWDSPFSSSGSSRSSSSSSSSSGSYKGGGGSFGGGGASSSW